VNCHPDGDSPHQRAGELHDPPVVRGPEDQGVPGNECTTCHQDKNQALTRVPGAPTWHLAPRAMAWVGRSRNGDDGRSILIYSAIGATAYNVYYVKLRKLPQPTGLRATGRSTLLSPWPRQ